MIGRESGYGLTESMDWHDPATASYTTAVTTMLDAAVDFGLTPDEARRTLHEAMADPRREASVAAYLDRIAGALARTILAKQRRLRGSFDI
jgi:phage terminase small subunit